MLRFDLPAKMQAQALSWRASGETIGLVPTMGYLHEGHLELVNLAKQKASRVIASIFVNPTQFAPSEDLTTYPRDEAGDLEKLERAGVDAVFLPTPQTMYPQGFQTQVQLSEISRGLCGASRPGHFTGVATVVLKLFHISQAHCAVFGEKDYQQLAVIRQMVADLNLPIEVIGAPTVRSPEGLALSSRNSYLTEKERNDALLLSQAIAIVQTSYRAGERSVSALLEKARALFEKNQNAQTQVQANVQPSIQIDYLEIVDADSLKPLEQIDRPARFMLAVKIGKTRLIDNGRVGDFSIKS